MKIVMLATRSGDAAIADPMAVLAASRLALYSGHDVKIVQCRKGDDWAPGLREALDWADVLGVSCITSSCIRQGIEATGMFLKPKGCCVWGGWHASIMTDQVLKFRGVDAVIVGQGERTFLDYLDGKPFDKIPGLAYHAMGFRKFNRARPLEDVNNFPSTPYHLIDVEANLRKTVFGNRTLRYSSSQGCPHRCGFCVEPTLYNRRWSGLNAKRVVDELGILADKYGVDSFVFTDSNFFTNPERVADICRLIIERNMSIRWGDANGRTRQLLNMPEETWNLMEASGCRGILVGAESALQDGLDALHKDTSVDDTIQLRKLANRHGIGVTFSMMVGIPYLNQSKAQIAQTCRREFKEAVNMIDHLVWPGCRINHAMVFSFTPYPGTELWKRSLELGAVAPSTLEEWASFDLSHSNATWIPRDVAHKAEMVTSYILPWRSRLLLPQLKGKPLLYFIGRCIAWVCEMRWKLRWFRCGIDFWIYKQVLKRWSPK